ncbi:hypothetical protein JVT61DRAFT_9946 [Boletus reticuloceps]|uniref:Uncharacterized protein n=1 Tax=Boletus reticuloceps TaxID=495285 RepID=A0A8I3A5E1_9AGAM|nr:hypothetical protein JVT61DRAFT_9946 [Boletus reticuloceps]
MSYFSVLELHKLITSVNKYLIDILQTVHQTLQGVMVYGISANNNFQWVESTPGAEKEHRWLQDKKKEVKGLQGTSTSGVTNATLEIHVDCDDWK